MDDELYNLKQEHEIEIKKLKTEHETQKQEMTQSWQLINLQFKTQAEAIVDIYTTISEILPPVVQSLQTINQISQEGISSFGEVAILLHDTLKTKVITRELDFLMVELDILPRSILLGAVHVPPSKPIHQYLFDKYVSKSFYIFGDFNAKHTDWLCSNNNASGVQMKTWLENTGCEMIYPNQPTSKRSSAVIDFGIAHNAYGWKADVIKEGSSDHYPVLIQTPLSTGTNIVLRKTNWKKSTDTEGISAFLLHQLPTEYLQIVTIAFNKIAQSGIVLRKSKHAKVICLSKDGLYPAVDKLRPISLLSNFGKCFERIIHTRILKWCNDKGIFTDEQSGFTSERRLQARILSLVEDLRLTTAANNRPSLVIFVDFVSAFDKNVAPCTSYHTSQTRHSVTTTTVDFSVAQRKNNVNPCWRSGFTCSQHLCWQTSRALEKTFSKNIMELERQAEIAMKILEKFADDNLLPVNVQKTKALLVHDVVAPPYPKIKYKDVTIDFVKRFKYLDVEITTKLGW
ncbi:unnamed protein product, partial [Rotaria socialis]